MREHAEVRQGLRGIAAEQPDTQKTEERQFLENYDPSVFERPSVTVDILIFTVQKRKLKLLLVRRAAMPFRGRWAIPGGFLRMDESAEEAAARRIREEAGVENVHLEQLYTFSAVDRDPRTRVISVAYLAAVPAGRLQFGAGEETEEAALFTVSGTDIRSAVGTDIGSAAGPDGDNLILTAEEGTVLPPGELAFDHGEIVRTAVQRMRGKLDYTDLAFGFLEDPQSFTLAELRYVHEAILDRKLDVGNFRRWIKREYEAAGRIRETGYEQGAVGRPAMQYRACLGERD